MNQLRFGRGVDNRRYKATGFHYQYTSREAVLRLGEHLRLHPVLRGAHEPYRYERDVEEFLRWSPHVKNARDRGLAPGPHAEPESALSAGELERVEAAERRAIAAEHKAERALDRAKKAERRARAAADEAVERVNRAALPPPAPAQPASGALAARYDELPAKELIALVDSLPQPDLQALRDHERRHANRKTVLAAMDSALSSRESRA